jgi:uncharacterized protein YlxW (UPF0749 family)
MKTLADLNAQKQLLVNRLMTLQKDITKVNSEIEEAKKLAKEPSVSDHAVVRYLERAMGFDIDAVRDAILTDLVKSAMAAGVVSVTQDGVKLVIRDNRVITVTN